MKFRLFILFLSLMSLPLTVYGADSKKPVTPITKLDDATTKMLKGLSENQAKQFAAIRNNHGIIRAVEGVEKDILNASKSCSEHNPEFAESMQKRVGEWQASVDPILKDARERQESMIKLQDYASPKEAKAYLKKVDDAVAFKSKSMKSIPVTEKKECKKLLGTMDDTQEDLQELLVKALGLDKPIVQKP